MADISEEYREALSTSADPESFARLLDAAHHGADRVVRRRRITYAGLGTASLALAVAVGVGLPGALGADRSEPVAPAAVVTTNPPVYTPTVHTKHVSPPPSVSVSVPTHRVVPMSTKGPVPVERTAPANPAPGSPEAAGYLPHPELALAGEPVPYLDTYGVQRVTDERAAEDVPRAIPNPAGTPYAHLLLTDVWGASTTAGGIQGTSCDTSDRSKGIESTAGRSYTYRGASSLGRTDGDTASTIDRRSADLLVSTWAPGVDAVTAFADGRTSCMLIKKHATVPFTVQGADSSWMGEGGAVQLYSQYSAVAMAQKGTTLVSVETFGNTQAEADAMAGWFVRQSIARLGAEQAR